MNGKSLMVTGMACGMMFLSGCVETAGTSVVTRHNDGQTIVFEGSTRLKRWVEITGITYDQVNGMNRVHIAVTSRRHHAVRLQYRVAWFDANGMELDPDTRAYHPLILHGLDSKTITSVALHPNAVTSRLRIRDLRSAE